MLGDEEYCRLRDLAGSDRDDLGDLHRMLACREIDSPGERATTSRVYNEFDAAERQLNIPLRDTPSVGAIATAALEQDPKESVYVRVKEGPNELIPRRGLVSESFTTYLDLAEFALRLSSAGDRERLQSYI